MFLFKKGNLEKTKPNMEAIKDYKNKLVDLKNRESDLTHTILQLTEVRDSLDHCKKLRLNEFMEGFNSITSKLKEMYQVS